MTVISYLTMAAVTLSVAPALADGPSLHGFLEGDYSMGIDAANPGGGRTKLSEERGQIRLDGAEGRLRYLIKTDLRRDNADGLGTGELREGYADLSGVSWDLRVGRQVVTWGLGDLIFINDVFPKDYGAFFSKRPVEYLKKGVDGVKAGLYPEAVSLEAVVIPFFEPNGQPDPERFHLYDPMPSVTDRRSSEPPSTLRNTEVALRAYRELAGFEAALYLYNGFYRNPAMVPDSAASPASMDLRFPRLSVYGFSLQRGALDGVVSFEAGYYDSIEDRDGTDPFIPNSQAKLLAGYQRQLMEDLTLGVQYFGEYMRGYAAYRESLPSGFPMEPRYRQLASVRLTYLMMHQDLKLSWFSFHGLTDKDYYLNPEARYNFSDHVWGALGANLFGGKRPYTQFGSLDPDDNVYVQARYEF